MKLCFLCGEYPPAAHGGIGTMVRTLGRALVGAGHEVRVVGQYADLTETVQETDEGVDVWRMPQPRGRLRWIQGRRTLFQRIAAWTEQGETDLVEVPDWQGWAAHWPSLSVPVVARLHGSAVYFAAEMGRHTHWLTARLEANSLRRADFWCSVSDYTARRTKSLFGLPSGPDAILPNPVNVGPPIPWEGRRQGMVVFTGTLTEKKGVVQLVDAWRRVAPLFPEATLHLVGKDGTAPGGGSMTEHLQAQLDGLAPDRVRFHGQVPHARVMELLAEARVTVLPSLAEAFAIAPLEAMAAGCPTIASALGSGPELIENGVDGLTVDPRQPGEIEHALCRLLADEGLAERLGHAGRRKVESRFSMAHLLTANVQFYEACIQRHAAESGAGRVRVPVHHGGGRQSAMSAHVRDH